LLARQHGLHSEVSDTGYVGDPDSKDVVKVRPGWTTQIAVTKY